MNMKATMMRSKKEVLFEIDYHAHILPGCDHGSDSLETSLRQMAMAKAAGIRTICATPHFYPHEETMDHFLLKRARCYDELQNHRADPLPKILQGAEVLMCEGIDHMEHIDRLCLQGTRELLFEMPLYRWSDQLIASVLCLHACGDLELIMAHADRYPAADVELFIREGIKLQLNTDNLSKRFRNNHLTDWLKKGYVAYLGSDIHGTDIGYRYWNKCKKLQKYW